MPAIYRNLHSKCIEIIQFAFMCIICTRVQINLHHLEGRSKFAPGCKFAHGCKSFKNRSHGQKYTPGANLHPGANCAHERGLRQNHIQKRTAKYQNRRSKRIENIHFAFICTICTRVQTCIRVQINLLHLESRSKFATGCEFALGCKFLKHLSHG